MKNINSILLAIAAICLLSFVALGQNLKVEEIITKHNDAIGKKVLRDQVETLLLGGANEFQSKLPSITGGGKALVVSDAKNLFFLLSLNSKEYPYEKIGYFNDKISLPFVTAGARSPLGGFIAEHPRLLDNGLFMGCMSQRWTLLDSQKYGAKIISGGTKKVDGRKAYMLEYYPSDGASSEFTMRIFIDAETFNHVRTEYYHEISPKEDTFGTLGRQAGTKLILRENFSDFRTADGFTRPYVYKVQFESSSQSGLFEYDWTIKVAQYYLNQKLAPDFFTFEEKPAGK